MIRTYSQKSKNLQAVKNKKLYVASNQSNHCQSYYWLQSDMAMIPETDLSENGWVILGGNVQPVWFVDKGLSPNLFCNIKQI